jgi:hypothetical protein
MGTNVFGKGRWPDTIVDYRSIYDFSHAIVATHAYPPWHAYPPSGIALHYLTAQFDFSISAAFFLALTTTSAVGCWWLILRLLRLESCPGSPTLVLLAFAAASGIIIWDLRSQNCNLIFLFTLLLGVWYLNQQVAPAAGFWLALSFSLKLFSVLVIPYLLWKGRLRAFIWTLVFVALFWGLLPLCTYGFRGFVPVYESWYGVVTSNTQDRVVLNHPILISLRNSAHQLAAADQLGADWIVRGVQFAWVATGLFACTTMRRRKEGPGDAYGLLADIGLLTLAPIAVSPYLEPYHPVPYCISAMLLLCAAFDARQTRRLRLLALLLFTISLGLALAPFPWSVRGFFHNVNFIVATTGTLLIAWLRRSTGISLAMPMAAPPLAV